MPTLPERNHDDLIIAIDADRKDHSHFLALINLNLLELNRSLTTIKAVLIVAFYCWFTGTDFDYVIDLIGKMTGK